jgi:hypothetical protein
VSEIEEHQGRFSVAARTAHSKNKTTNLFGNGERADVITNLDARIARLQRKAQEVRAELERSISTQEKCAAAARLCRLV